MLIDSPLYGNHVDFFSPSCILIELCGLVLVLVLSRRFSVSCFAETEPFSRL
jgi:hypothetical protein